MSIEDVTAFIYDNEEDYIHLIHLIQCSEDQDLSFPEEYQKNVSDRAKNQSKLTALDVFPTNHTFETPKSLPIAVCIQKPRTKSEQKIKKEIFDPQVQPLTKRSDQTQKQSTYEEQKLKKISKQKYKKNIQIVLNYEERLKQSRQIKIKRYQEKKMKRNWNRGILYEERKKLAFRRVRIQGRFQGRFEDVLNMKDQKSWENSISK